MSVLTDYNELCQNYDFGRVAAGADIIKFMIEKYSDKSIKDIEMLDVGCGTGNYAKFFKDNGVKSLSLIDASTGMLNVAREKMKSIKNSTSCCYKQAMLPVLPFPNNVFDAAMTNMVLHHLEKSSDAQQFPTISKTINEIYRVLKPGGIYAITTCTSLQVQGIWYCHLVPNRIQDYCKTCPDTYTLQEMLKKAGFATKLTASVSEPEYNRLYFDIEGPLKESVRNTDSFWSMLTKSEVDDAVMLVKKMSEDGTLREFFEKHDQSENQGAYTIIVAKK